VSSRQNCHKKMDKELLSKIKLELEANKDRLQEIKWDVEEALQDTRAMLSRLDRALGEGDDTIKKGGDNDNRL